ncbi:hypothetical protein DAH18_12680 [Escherichia coli]|nr:hypothetical protein DAH35_12630 [Escherichia coli]TGG64584.1 hypothetical protein DAH18_12680 [Escherichia coli]TJF27104.1 hypothetical protein C9198_23580 [Escherichia coli]TJG44677.1 hypothetical protein C9174_15475 [Escherichia coli]TJM46238.1 hypothetical protein C9049_15255 [Escherichia coli]
MSDPKAKTRLVGGFLRISGAGLGIEDCFYHVDIILFCLVKDVPSFVPAVPFDIERESNSGSG